MATKEEVEEFLDEEDSEEFEGELEDSLDEDDLAEEDVRDSSLEGDFEISSGLSTFTGNRDFEKKKKIRIEEEDFEPEKDDSGSVDILDISDEEEMPTGLLKREDEEGEVGQKEFVREGDEGRDFSRDYSSRSRRDGREGEEERREGEEVSYDSQGQGRTSENVSYSNLADVALRQKNFYETGGRRERGRNIYTAKGMADKGSRSEFFHEKSFLEKQTEREDSLMEGRFGIAAERRERRDTDLDEGEKNPYENLKYEA